MKIPVLSYEEFRSPVEGSEMYDFAKTLFPICRSLTGDGVRKTLSLIEKQIGSQNFKILETPSGTQVYDWTVPLEWNILEAYIVTPEGQKIANFSENNLHVVGYSEPIDREIDLEELKSHLFSLPEQPSAIPYVTSYYRKFWGFCISHNHWVKLKPGKYRVVIKSELKNGFLTSAELLIPGKTSKEIFISTYVCHPSMANNELSGPVVSTYLAKWLFKNQKDLSYTYRFVFIPETIGSINYISQNIDHMKSHIKAGFVVTCVGDDRAYSFLPSRKGNTYADQVARFVLNRMAPSFKSYSFNERGSDERQYCSPGVDLPMCSIMRTKYGEYPEYHTSLDNLDLITPQGLDGALSLLKASIFTMENDRNFLTRFPCEPQLGKRGLYPNVSTKTSSQEVRNLMNFISNCDGKTSLLQISNETNIDFVTLAKMADKLMEKEVIDVLDSNFQ